MKFVNLSSLLRDTSETDNLFSLVASRGLSLDFVTVSTAGNINDYDTSNEGVFKFTGASELRGFGAGRDGKTIYIHNGSAGNITLVNQSGDANAGDRVITGTGGNLTIKPDTGLVLQYDGTSSRWRIPAFTKNTPTGDIVGTSDSQTLTNKTISADDNTISGIAASSFVLSNASGNIDGNAAQKAIPTGTVVGTSDSQTLTNKTLEGFTLTGDITGTGTAVDFDLIDNNASALSFDTAGKSGILEIDTTDGSEKVKMSGDLEVSGNFTVNGTTTNVNTTNLVVEDKNIILGDVASPTNTTADGGGITLKGLSDKTLNWTNSTSSWTSSENIDLASGKYFSINSTYRLRYGMSAMLTSGTVDLSAAPNLVYYANGNSVSGTVTSGAINFTNGQAGEIIYLRVNSGGTGSYSFGANMRFPSDVAPVPSASGKVDVYSFLCISSTQYYGTFAFNYS